MLRWMRFNRLSKNDGALNEIFKSVHKSKSIGLGFSPFAMIIIKTKTGFSQKS
jgi:hypothetical protein